MTFENLAITSETFWTSAALFAAIDVAFILVLTWRVKPPRFRELKWLLVGTAAFLWSAFSLVLVEEFWDSYYQHFYPGWFRSGGIYFLVPLLYGLFALAFHWLALRLPGNPIVAFSLLGGAESVLEHIWGVFGFRILDVPALQEASPISILVFSFPEYILYWCVVISLAVLLQTGWRMVKRKPGKAAAI